MTAELSPRDRAFTLVATLLGLFLAALDMTIVATAGPAIQRDLNIEASLYAWITTANLVASTTAIPIFGKLSDVFGRKPVLIWSIGVFMLGSLLAGLAPSTLPLILARAVQGLGAAGLLTNAFAIVADLFPPAIRGRYVGIFGAVFGLASVIGPFLGGFLTDNLSWSWVFFVNLPLGALAMAFVIARMPALQPARVGPVRVDFAGAAWLVVAVVPFLVALGLGRPELAEGEAGLLWRSVPMAAMLAASALGLIMFIRTESRSPNPILDLGLFRNRTFTAANLAAFTLGASFLGAVVFLPLFMVNVVGLSATSAGLTIMPLTFGVIFGNVVSGQIVSRIGRYKPLMLAGLAVLVAGFTVMGFTLTPDSSQLDITWKMLLVGLGLGPALPLYSLAVQNSVPHSRVGEATAAVTFFRQMGSSIGVALLGAVFGATLAAELTARISPLAAGLPPGLTRELSLLAAGGAGGHALINFPGEALRDLARREIGDTAALLAQVDRLERAHRQAFTDSVARIYRVSLVFVAIGFAITLLIPELPLRKSNRDPLATPAD